MATTLEDNVRDAERVVCLAPPFPLPYSFFPFPEFSGGSLAQVIY